MSPRPRLTEVRRRQILEAAGEVIAERGIAESRITDIAERIGVSPALVLYYFKSKDVLLGEALAHRERQFFEAVEEAMTGETSATRRLLTLIEASCPGVDETIEDDYLLWIETWARSRHDPGLARIRRTMDARFRRAIAEVVEAGQRTGEFDPGVDPVEFAVKLAALIDGLAIQVVLGDDQVGTGDMLRLCVAAAREDLRLEPDRHPA